MKARALLATIAPLVIHVGACSVDDRIAVINRATDPAPGSLFTTIRAGQPLPDDATCAARVRRSTWEPRPENATANRRPATAAEIAQFAPWNHTEGYDDRAMTLSARVTGNFTGTTDEILQ